MAVILMDAPTTVSPQCPTVPDNARAVTPSDVDTFSQPVALYIGGSGNVSVVPAGSGPAMTVAVLAGTVLPFRVVKVNATSTTATGLVAVY